MDEYYDKFFPFRTWFQWLNHSPIPSDDFTHREFALIIKGGDPDSDIYVRHQSFDTVEMFQKKVHDTIPKRFEVGPVCQVPPKEARRSGKSSVPLSKELVFDIDLTDYKEYRKACCGDKAQCCIKCWQFVTVAIEVLSKAFDEDFGYKHVLWVFSGRRGVHAWVCDDRARKLDDQQRRDLVEYLSVKSSQQLRPFHPHLQRSFDICNRDFDKVVLQMQNPWQTLEGSATLIKQLERANTELAVKLRELWATNGASAKLSSREKWQEIDLVASKIPKLNKQLLAEIKQNIVLDFLYPKLDENVTLQRGHLLKSPFCVHPSTGKVCVPISTDKYRQFNPANVPTVDTLMEERDTAPNRGRLAPYVHEFKLFVRQLNRVDKRPADTLDF